MLTLSNPHAVGGAKLAGQARLRFAGKEEYEKYLKKTREFGPDTFKRIADIAYVSHNQGPKHITLAKKYAEADPNIAYMNDEITSLIRGRNGKRTSDPEASAKSAEYLDDFRRAVATSLEEHGYPEHGRALDETERNQLLQPPPPAPAGGIVQAVVNMVSAFWGGVRSLLS